LLRGRVLNLQHCLWRPGLADDLRSSERRVEGRFDERARRRGNGALPAACYLARNYAGMRLAELGEIAGGVTYPAVSTAIKRSVFSRAAGLRRDKFERR
jgi:hypothetical protein